MCSLCMMIGWSIELGLMVPLYEIPCIYEQLKTS